MSQHHRDQSWTKHNAGLRAVIKAALPLPCVDCGHPVLPEHKWQVGHIIPASAGGLPELSNVGPSHSANEYWPRNCNQIAGGRMGAAAVNNKRKEDKRHFNW